MMPKVNLTVSCETDGKIYSVTENLDYVVSDYFELARTSYAGIDEIENGLEYARDSNMGRSLVAGSALEKLREALVGRLVEGLADSTN